MKTLAPSDRSFGWTFTGLFLLIGTISHPWMLALAALTALVTVTRAHWLAPLKDLWMKFGELLHHVVSPVVFAVLFFAVFTPAAMVMRLIGRDALSRRFEPGVRSYWVTRDPPGPAEDSFRDPF